MTLKSKEGTENEIKFDTSYFLRLIGMTNEELQRSIEDKKIKLVAQEQETATKKDELQKAIEENNDMDEELLNEQLDYEILSEGCKTFNEQLIELQKQFNTIVDPFNNVRASMMKNKENHHILARLYNEENKKIENHKNQLHQKVVTTAWKIKDIREKIVQKQQSLDSINEVCENKLEALNQSREQRQTAAIEWNSIKLDELKQWMEDAKMMQEQVKIDLEELQDLKLQTEEAIHELNVEHIQTQNKLKALQDDVAEGIGANDIKEQRLNNEKQIVEQVLQTKFNRHCQRIEDANMNIAKQLRDTLEETARREKLIGEMNLAIHQNAQKIQSLVFLKAEKILDKDQIAEQVQKALSGNQGLKEKQANLKKSIDALKMEKQEQLDDFEKTSKNYNARIKKEQRRQTVVGVIDDGNSSVTSIDDIKSVSSEISSSISGSNMKAEKTNFDASRMTDTSTETSSTMQKRQKKK